MEELNYDRVNTNCFASSYNDARQMFLDAAGGAGAEVESVKHPLSGPDNQALFMDVARLGARKPSRILITVSGTHGPEGYCGSAAQVSTLRHLDASTLGRETAVLFVHAHNPFGFAWNTRCTHENIDLNRNFVDHRSPPANRLADDFYQALGGLPDEWSDEFIIHFENTKDRFSQEFGRAETDYWLGFGQYRSNNGLHFGGSQQSWSNRTFLAALSEYRSDARAVSAVDFHTGLGRYGYGELLSPFNCSSANYKNSAAAYGQTVRSMPGGQSVATYSAGNVSESIVDYFSTATVIANALEFGTYEGEQLQRAKLRSHWLSSRSAFDHSDSESIRRDYRAIFYPEFDDWKELVLQRAMMVIRQSLSWAERTPLEV